MWTLAAATVDLGPAIQQIGIGALIAVPAYTVCWVLWKQLQAASERERMLTDRLGPLLSQAVTVLASTPDQLERVLQDTNSTVRRSEVDNLMREMQQQVDRLRDR